MGRAMHLPVREVHAVGAWAPTYVMRGSGTGVSRKPPSASGPAVQGGRRTIVGLRHEQGTTHDERGRAGGSSSPSPSVRVRPRASTYMSAPATTPPGPPRRPNARTRRPCPVSTPHLIDLLPPPSDPPDGTCQTIRISSRPSAVAGAAVHSASRAGRRPDSEDH